MNRLARCAALAVAGALAATACGSGDDTTAAAPIVDAGAPDTATKSDATATAPVHDATVPATAFVRIAAWSLDAPAVDFCLAPAGSGAFHGPLLSTTFMAPDDGGTLGIAFAQVSSYMTAPVGTFDVRFVAAGSADCTTAVGADYSGWALAANSHSTFAALGSAAAAPGNYGALRIVPMVDDSVVAPGDVAIRFVEADADGDSVSFGGLALGPLFTNMQFPEVSASKYLAVAPTPTLSVDARGYVTVAAVPNDTFAVSAIGAGGLPVAPTATLGLAAGAIVTFVLVPSPPGRDASTSAQLVECVDNAGTVGVVGNCAAVP